LKVLEKSFEFLPQWEWPNYY